MKKSKREAKAEKKAAKAEKRKATAIQGAIRFAKELKAEAAAKVADAAADAAPRTAMKINPEAVLRSRIAGVQSGASVRNPFEPARPMPGVVPGGYKPPTMAMDYAPGGFGEWSNYGEWAAMEEGQLFVGFPKLSVLAQRAEYRLVAETLATEATRHWITFEAADGKDKGDRIKKLEAFSHQQALKDRIKEVCEHDFYFGRAHMFLNFGADEGPEVATDIGDGLVPLSKTKTKRDSFNSIKVVEPLWVYPQQFNSLNPLADDFYRPNTWYVYSKPVHRSRLLTFVSREVPDLLKSAYSFAGLSGIQMLRPYVDNWLDTRQAVTALLKSFTRYVLGTDMAALMGGGNGDEVFARAALFTATAKNSDVMVIDKEKEDFKNVSAPLGTLDALQAQAQEHIASVAQMPLIKLTGISPSGLNASGEQEMQCWEDRVLAYQESFLRPNLMKWLRFAQLSLFGSVDEGITFKFNPLEELTEQEEGELRKQRAETGEILVRSKAISSKEERARVAADLGGPYHAIDPEAGVEYPMTENEKADYAGKIATAAATLVAEGLMMPATALKEIQAAAEISGFGLEITDEDITEAENMPPAPSELEPETGAGETDESGAGGKGVEPRATKGIKAAA